MNMSQLLEGLVAKNVMLTEDYIKTFPDKTCDTLSWLNHKIIKNLGDNTYFNDVNLLIDTMKSDKDIFNKFHEDINRDNLFVEAPAFSNVDIRELYKNSVPPEETVIIKKETLKYMKQKLKIDFEFTFTDDVKVPKIFCAPIYTMKLHKLAEHIISARDLGPIKQITRQPLKGRATGGGNRLGQMEIKYSLLN